MTKKERLMPRLVFVASAAALLATVFTRVPVLPTHLLHGYGFFDLKVYRVAAGAVLAGRPLYAMGFTHGLGFTYPPFAALLFVALRAVPATLGQLAITLLNVALVAIICRRTLDLQPPACPQEPSRRRATVWLAAAGALWFEPIASAIGYGQIDLLIVALVLVDLTRGDGHWWGGFGVGLAAALKLTPLVFIGYLALTGRLRTAARAVGVFALSIFVSFDVLPGAASTYWGGAAFDTSRVTGRHGGGGGPADQSLRGAWLRIAPRLDHLDAFWLASCLIVAGVGLWLAVRAGRRGEAGWGFVLTAVTGLLISPISWTHHWAIAIPGLLLLIISPAPTRRARLCRALAVAFAAGSWTIWLVITTHRTGVKLDPLTLAVGDLYVIAGLTTLTVAAAREIGARARAAHNGAEIVISGTFGRPRPDESGGRPVAAGRERPR